MLYTILLILFLIVCIIMTITILLQSSKGGGLAGAFGGASMGAVFGGRGTATFLSKFTTWLAVLYLLIALGLSKLYSSGTSGSSDSIISQKREEIQQSLLPPPVDTSIPAVGIDTDSGEPVPANAQPDTSK
jgi:preprotein translocase subunit SecG